MSTTDFLMITKPTVLLMTATITPPNNCPDLKRTDPEIRMHDYFEALKFYVQIPPHFNDRIIFAENSNTDLTALKKIENFNIHNKQIEFISFKDGNSFPPEYGKGYGEMLLMDYALNESQLIKQNDRIWKATGRLVLKNFSKLIHKSPDDYDLYCDIHHDFPMFKLTHFFDPRFYSFNLEGYTRWFRPYISQLKGAHIEDFFYKILIEDLSHKKLAPRFKDVPLISGFVGSSNKNYMTVKKIIQRIGQQCMRVVFPWLWI